MNATLKRATIVLSVFVCVEMAVLCNLVFTSQGVGAIEERTLVMEAVSDIVYDSTANMKTEVKEAEEVEAVEEAPIEEPEVKLTEEAEKAEIVENDWQPFYEEDYDYADYNDDYNPEAIAPDYDNSDNANERVNANVDENWISGSDFKFNGVHQDSSGYSYTYYSENVLPGGGLDIPGRHVGDEGYVCDADGNICIASDDLPYGTVVDVPFGSGTAVVYDCGSGSGNLDIYTSW